MAKIPINEIFGSVQGEGIFVGMPTVFVRVQGCNRNCGYCDTPGAKGEGGELLDIERIVSRVKSAFPGCGNVTFTGGEPLLYRDQLEEVFDALILREGYRIYLETNGDFLADVFSSRKKVGLMNSLAGLTVSPKLPGSGEEPFQNYDEGIFDPGNILFDRENLCTKFVICDRRDFDFVIAKCLEKGDAIPCPALQPVHSLSHSLTYSTLCEWLAQEIGKVETEIDRSLLVDIRVIPQVHRLVGLR